ncbi:MAG: MFS transporter [Desulfobacterales bacterium CG23_combo_of_CG06-09_8_20_14_all_52_9]|nr:MAG: MFS transporter [Desulfobacterales bacterium CG23_combo_of_CG06-09_8_20_14_all_52_9]
MHPTQPPDPASQEKAALWVTTVTSFMGPFTISSVNVALPAIQKEFGINAVELGWIATAFLLAVAVVLVPAGKIADLYGRKKVFTSGLALFTFSSLFAAFSTSVGILIFFRVFQGIGAALFVTTGMAILTSIFPPQRRGKAIGIYVAAVYAGLSTGPFVGGFLTQQLGWRSLFIAGVPLGGASVYITLALLKGEWADARGERLDLLGSFLYGFSILALVYGTTALPKFWAVCLIFIGLILLLVFIRYELRVHYPIFEVRLFVQNKVFTFSSLAALIHYSATYGITFLLSLYLQYIKGLTPQAAGTLLVAQPVIMTIFSPFAGKTSDRVEPRILASIGMAITATGLFIFSFIGPQTEIFYIAGTLAGIGFGFALFSSPNMSAIMGAVENRLFGIASGAVATMRILGQMVSMSIVMVVFSIFIGNEKLTPDQYPFFLKAAQICFVLFAAMCTVGIFFSYFRGHLRKTV